MSAKRLTISAFFMALVIILSSSLLSIPVPGGHFYFNGIVIFLVGLIFPPTEAVIIAGGGSGHCTHCWRAFRRIEQIQGIFRSLAWSYY